MSKYDLDRLKQVSIRQVIGDETGKEWVQRGHTEFINCPMHNDPGPSLSIDEDKNVWHCHSTSCGVGGDVIRFIELSKGMEFQDAIKYLADTYDSGAETDEDAPKSKKQSNKGRKPHPLMPIPDGALNEALPKTLAGDWWKEHYGEFKAAWRYHLAEGGVAYVDVRFEYEKDGKTKKDVVPLYFSRQGRWKMGIPFEVIKQLRILYNLHLLMAEPERPVLVVEGCKCASVNPPGLRDAFILTTWPQGGNGVPHVDVRPLYERKVIIWPDNDMVSKKLDRGGYKAAYLMAEKLKGKSEVIILRAATHPGGLKTKHGYDIEDYIADGGDTLKYIEDTANHISLEDTRELAGILLPELDDTPHFKDVGKFTELTMPHPETVSKVVRGFDRNDKGKITKSDGNFLRVTEHDPAFRYLIAYDTDTNQLMHSDRYTELDEMDNSIWQYCQRYYEIAPSKAQRTDMVKSNAYRNSFSSLEVFLDELKQEQFGDKDPHFDHNPLLDILSHITFALEEQYTDIDEINKYYTELFDKYFKRMFIKLEYIINGEMDRVPPADIVPILEGDQGLGKTRFCNFISIEPRKFYVDMAELQLTTSRDTVAKIRGKLIGELGELAGLKRTELEAIKAFISSTFDEMRRLYSESTVRSPRTISFIGTTNEREYLRDTTGNRRFWPVRIQTMDHELYNKPELAKQLYVYYREQAKKAIADNKIENALLVSHELFEFMQYQREEKRVLPPFVDDIINYLTVQENAVFSDDPVKVNVQLAARYINNTPENKPVTYPPRFVSEFTRIVIARGYISKVGMLEGMQRRLWQLNGRICTECKTLKKEYTRITMLGDASSIICKDCETTKTQTPEGDPF